MMRVAGGLVAASQYALPPFLLDRPTQAAWARESQIDMIARRLGADRLEMRLKNAL